MNETNTGTKTSLRPDQILFLSLLALLTSATTFLMHHSRQPASNNGGMYSVGTSVFLAELFKLSISTSAVYYDKIKSRTSKASYSLLSGSETKYSDYDVEKVTIVDRIPSLQISQKPQARGWNDGNTWQRVHKEILTPDSWKMGVPAVLYVVQNTLQLYATATVSPILYQALTQLKILAATVLSMWLLKRTFSPGQWVSLTVLIAGVTLVSVSKMDTSPTVENAKKLVHVVADQTSIIKLTHDIAMEKIAGVISVILACTLGSAAAVYVELNVKSDAKVSLWVRNAQLAFFSLIPALAGVFYDAYTMGKWAPMRYFGSWAWLTVLVRTLSGFLVAVVLKYTDSILKGFATSLAIILSLFIEIVFFGRSCSISFLFGTFLVVASTSYYSKL